MCHVLVVPEIAFPSRLPPVWVEIIRDASVESLQTRDILASLLAAMKESPTGGQDNFADRGIVNA